jgi:hypothetical protein
LPWDLRLMPLASAARAPLFNRIATVSVFLTVG